MSKTTENKYAVSFLNIEIENLINDIQELKTCTLTPDNKKLIITLYQRAENSFSKIRLLTGVICEERNYMNI